MTPTHPASDLREWLSARAQPMDISNPSAVFNVLVESLPAETRLLGFGEALHGGEEILQFRNGFFRHLVETQRFSAIALESSFPRAQRVNDFVAGGDGDLAGICEAGFGQGMGAVTANRELVAWMRQWNRGKPDRHRVAFYGFDLPTGTQGVASPRQVIETAVAFLTGHDPSTGRLIRERVSADLGEDAAWENPAVYMDPSQSITAAPAALRLRATLEDLIGELRARRPELAATSGEKAFDDALHSARLARQLLNFHVAMGSRKPGQSPAGVLGTRDVLMADNLVHILRREADRGKVLAFAHNSHLQRARAVWPGQTYWGTDDPCAWWPAGSHLEHYLGRRYAVIGTAVGVSPENGITEPEAETTEGILRTFGDTAFFVSPTRAEFPDARVRTGSTSNPTYVPLTGAFARSVEGLLFLPQTGYQRGGPPLTTWDAEKPSQE